MQSVHKNQSRETAVLLRNPAGHGGWTTTGHGYQHQILLLRPTMSSYTTSPLSPHFGSVTRAILEMHQTLKPARGRLAMLFEVDTLQGGSPYRQKGDSKRSGQIRHEHRF